MRRSLYIKDDDWRHSLLYGNYITMTNIPDSELNRIVARRAQPLYISVHTVNEDLRKYILGNETAADIRPILEFLYKNKISFHSQVVLLPGLNGGDKLKETVEYLYNLHPVCLSLAVVPVGLTAHREHLPEVEPADSKTAYETVRIIEEYARPIYFDTKNRFVYASDELYIKAGLDIPDFQAYDDFPQIENGVGGIAKFLDDVDFAVNNIEGELTHSRVSFATGEDFYPFLCAAAEKLSGFFGIDINIYKIENEFFGPCVTVSGLLTGQDIAAQLAGKDLGEILYLTPAMLNADGLFLDDTDIKRLSHKLGIPVGTANIESLPFVRRADE
jgi:putative radical SAM enzyme (TIGR03279 family)